MMMRRRGWQPRTRRSSRRSAERRPPGRRAATRCEWQIIRFAVVLRARFRCQACGRQAPLDVHHVVKRAQGGSDFDLDHLVALCRRCHDLTDASYTKGRLVVIPLGDGAFCFDRQWHSSKANVVASATESPVATIAAAVEPAQNGATSTPAILGTAAR